MFPYCYYCHNDTKDINRGPVITKNKLILNKTNCLNCNHKNSKHYQILSTQDSKYKC